LENIKFPNSFSLTENYGWQTIFFVNVLPTIVMVSALYLSWKSNQCS
jgi:nucleoside permease NupC